MSDLLLHFESAIVGLQRHCVIETRRVNSEDDLDNYKQQQQQENIYLAQSHPLICELVHCLLAIISNGFISLTSSQITPISATTATTTSSTTAAISPSPPTHGNTITLQTSHGTITTVSQQQSTITGATVSGAQATILNNTSTNNNNNLVNILASAIPNQLFTAGQLASTIHGVNGFSNNTSAPHVGLTQQGNSGTVTAVPATNGSGATPAGIATSIVKASPRELWNHANNLLGNRNALEFIKSRCSFLPMDESKLLLWLLLEISEKSIESLFDQIAQTEFIMLYDIDSCIRDKFMRLIELSRILANIAFRIDGRMPSIYRSFIREITSNDIDAATTVSAAAANAVAGQSAAGGTQQGVIGAATTAQVGSNGFASQQTQQKKQFHHSSSLRNINSENTLPGNSNHPTNSDLYSFNFNQPLLHHQPNTSVTDMPKLFVIHNESSVSQDQLDLQSIPRRRIDSISKIDFNNVSPIARVVDDSDEETTRKPNIEYRPAAVLKSFQSVIPSQVPDDLKPLKMAQIAMRTFINKGRPSQLLYESRFSKIKDNFTPKSSEPSTIELQGYQCNECKNKISKGLYIIGVKLTFGQINNAHFCYASERWYCSDCISGEKRPIWWKAMESFDLTSYKVSKRMLSEIERLYTMPVLRVEYDAEIVKRSQILYDFMVLKRSVYLIYDMICVPEYVENALGPTHHNLCVRSNLLSLKDFYDINNGSLARTLEEVIRVFVQHTNSCEVCLKKGIECSLCSSEKLIFVYDLRTTSLCDRCNTMYHSKCLEVFDCPKCKHDN